MFLSNEHLIQMYQQICGILFVSECIYAQQLSQILKPNLGQLWERYKSRFACVHERQTQLQPQEKLRLVSKAAICLVVCLTVFLRILPDSKVAHFPSRDNEDKDWLDIHVIDMPRQVEILSCVWSLTAKPNTGRVELHSQVQCNACWLGGSPVDYDP